MKKILIALCAVATLASCTKNEVLSYDQEAIGFDNAFVDNSTRSVEDPSFSTTNMFSNFQVYGFVAGQQDVAGVPVFGEDGVTVTKTGTKWTYGDVQYWIKDANYDFYAIAPCSGNWAIKADTTPTDTRAIITFTNEKTIDNGDGTNTIVPGAQDLLYAGIVERVGAASGNRAVELTFNHILSKVKFSFVNNYNATSATIRVKDIKITNAYKTANATLTSAGAAWSEHTSVNGFEIAFGNATDDQSTGDKENDVNVSYGHNKTYESYFERFVIPAAAPTGDWNITFTVDLLVSGQLIKTYNHTAKLNTTFEPGKAYDITAAITATNIDPTTSQEPIEFTAKMNDWKDGDNENEDRDATVVDPNSPQQGNN